MCSKKMSDEELARKKYWVDVRFTMDDILEYFIKKQISPIEIISILELCKKEVIDAQLEEVDQFWSPVKHGYAKGKV